jgi:hypothetical protein
MKRPKYNPEEIEAVFLDLRQMLEYRIAQKGDGIYVSSHETKGIIDEEVEEYHDEVRANNADGQYKELKDIGVGVIFGMASIRSNEMDWL